MSCAPLNALRYHVIRSVTYPEAASVYLQKNLASAAISYKVRGQGDVSAGINEFRMALADTGAVHVPADDTIPDSTSDLRSCTCTILSLIINARRSRSYVLSTGEL